MHYIPVTYFILLNPLHLFCPSPSEGIITRVLQMQTVKYRKMKSLPQGHTVTGAVQPNQVWLQRQGVCKHILCIRRRRHNSFSV